jgi:hypothetical protein
VKKTYSWNSPGITISLDSSAGQKCLDIIVGCTFDCNKFTHQLPTFDESAEQTNSFLRLDMAIDSLRIRHVLQQDLAHLQRGFSKSDLQDFDVPSLVRRHEHQFNNQRTKKTTCLLLNPLKVPIFDSQKPLRKQDLQLFHKKIF